LRINILPHADSDCSTVSCQKVARLVGVGGCQREVRYDVYTTAALEMMSGTDIFSCKT